MAVNDTRPIIMVGGVDINSEEYRLKEMIYAAAQRFGKTQTAHLAIESLAVKMEPPLMPKGHVTLTSNRPEARDYVRKHPKVVINNGQRKKKC